MKIEYDSLKNARNIKERSLPFSLAIGLDWLSSFTLKDTRQDYSEDRYVTLAYLDKRLHVICYTPIPDGIRVISFRKANSREVKRYEQR